MLFRSEASDSEDNAIAAQGAAETARDLAQSARDRAEQYANQAYQTTPTVIQEGILLAQLHGELFDGSTL